MVKKSKVPYIWMVIIVLFVIGIAIFLTYKNSPNETKFVCPDGSIVVSQNLCPATQTNMPTSNQQTPEVTTQEVTIYEGSGQIQQSLTSALLMNVNSGGSSYSTNLYKGGAIEMAFTSSATLKYKLSTGGNCVLDKDTITLKEGSIKDGIVSWSPTNVIPTELCIKLENLNFVDWNNINLPTYSLVVKETQTK